MSLHMTAMIDYILCIIYCIILFICDFILDDDIDKDEKRMIRYALPNTCLFVLLFGLIARYA